MADMLLALSITLCALKETCIGFTSLTIYFICNERVIRSSQLKDRYISWNDNLYTYMYRGERKS